jgi:hypothetical protein
MFLHSATPTIDYDLDATARQVQLKLNHAFRVNPAARKLEEREMLCPGAVLFSRQSREHAVNSPVTHAIATRPILRLAISGDGNWLAAYHPNNDWQLVLRPLPDPAAKNILVTIQGRDPDFRFAPQQPLLVVGDCTCLKVCNPHLPAPTAEPLIDHVIFELSAFAITSNGGSAIIAKDRPALIARPSALSCWKIWPEVGEKPQWEMVLTNGDDLPPRGLGLLPGEEQFAVVEKHFDSPNNRYIERVVVYDVGRANRQYELPPPGGISPAKEYCISTLVVNSRKPQAAGLMWGFLIVWTVEPHAGAPRRFWGGEPIRAIAFHPDGQWLFAATEGGVLRYDTETWTVSLIGFEVPGHPTALAVSFDGSLLAVGTMEGAVTVGPI